MGIELIYPTINLFQYNLREGLGDSNAVKLARSQSFYSKFLPDLKDLAKYRQREQPDREFNQLLYTDRSTPVSLALSPQLDGFYYPVQLGDTYALQLNYSGKLVGSKPDLRSQDLDTAVIKLIKQLEGEKRIPDLDSNSFGQTYLITAFINHPQADRLAIAKDCDRQITERLPHKLTRSINHGEWMGGNLFEFWTPPQSFQGDLQSIINQHPHTIVWLFSADKFDAVNSQLTDAYQNWMRSFHYRHKIFYAYYQSQLIKNKLKLANTEINKIGDRLRSSNPSLPHLQNLLFDTLIEFQSYSENVQALEDQQYTIEIARENYQLRCTEMTKEYPSSNLQFLLELETKYSNKYERQIRADRAHLDSGLKVLENLSQTIQGTIQIEQTKSDRTTNLTIAAFGTGLAASQVVCAIVIAQTPQDRIKNLNFYNTSAFEKSLISGSIPIVFLLMYLVWVKVKNYKSSNR
jgi:hypothetical protein